ncbi:MAG: cell division protein FtsQ/DivIB [Rhizobiaceae bacterium]
MSSLKKTAGFEALPDKGVHPLARMLRLQGRSFVRFVESLPRLRRGAGHLLAVSIVVAGWGYGAAIGGSGKVLVSGAAATLGLKATDITIMGQIETREQEIFTALGVGRSLVGFNVANARARVLELPWINDVAIRKIYPGRLTVAIAEKRAMAVWQHKDRLTVVESTGVQIAKFGIADLISNRFSHLPHLVGEGAAESANEILPLAAKYPALSGRVSSYVRVANRRWDMVLNNGIRIKLPEHGAAGALAHVAELAGENRVLEREISVVDMRISDRVVLRLEEAAAITRAELVSARLKAMKKADRKL